MTPRETLERIRGEHRLNDWWCDADSLRHPCPARQAADIGLAALAREKALAEALTEALTCWTPDTRPAKHEWMREALAAHDEATRAG